MKKELKITQYPVMLGDYGWWHKPINPTLSIIILGVALIIVFVIGAWFADQYIKTSIQINEQTQKWLNE